MTYSTTPLPYTLPLQFVPPTKQFVVPANQRLSTNNYPPPFVFSRPPVSTILLDRSLARSTKAPKEIILKQNFLQQLRDDFKETFIQLPKTVVMGLRGSSNFTFSDKMRLATIPYYLGGAFLCLSYVAGRDMVRGGRQFMAVLFYVLGIGITNKLIDTIYKLKYGINLNLRYRTLTGGKEKVFASSDFPRFDLLSQEHYKKLARGFHIPPDTNDTQGAVNNKLKETINQSRVLKIVLGNLAAVFGAGYFAQTKMWQDTIPRLKVMPLIIKEHSLTPSEKMASLWMTLSNVLMDPLVSKAKGRERGTAITILIFTTGIFACWALYQTLKLGYKKQNHNVESEKLQSLIQKAIGNDGLPQTDPPVSTINKQQLANRTDS